MASQAVASESSGVTLQMTAREVNGWGNLEIRYVSSRREHVRTPNGVYIPINDNYSYHMIPSLFIRVPPQVVSSPEWHRAYLNSKLSSRLNFENAPVRATVAENISSFALQHQAASRFKGYLMTVELNFFHEIFHEEIIRPSTPITYLSEIGSFWEATVNDDDGDLAPNGGASRSAIVRLMEKGSFVASKSDQELGTCSICLEEFASSNGAKDQLLRMDCSHVYHRACILPWLQKTKTCPTCRRQVD
ncbi:E3 ubiquitin-protein ligase RNF12-B-like [Juglans regia]|uniref:E3 ubiquitin-protein ligase RNF12-B-like n=1 Tax=Juglans regia TaxID=51240 RepID=A0A6P9EWL5_JUGRE|nr:E3 ubiquitin-protein ligase RNF12-B-like [Juglans regia]